MFKSLVCFKVRQSRGYQYLHQGQKLLVNVRRARSTADAEFVISPIFRPVSKIKTFDVLLITPNFKGLDVA